MGRGKQLTDPADVTTRHYALAMDRRALPLLLASARSIEADETEPLDRLRMQKGVFLLEQRGPDHGARDP